MSESISMPSAGRKPQRLNHGSLYIHLVIKNLQEQGLVHSILVYSNVAARKRQEEKEEFIDGFSQAKSGQDRWHISILHEIAASFYKKMSEGSYKSLELSRLRKTEATDGVFIATVTSSNRNVLLRYECVYCIFEDGLHTTGLVLDSTLQHIFTVTAVLVLDLSKTKKVTERPST